MPTKRSGRASTSRRTPSSLTIRGQIAACVVCAVAVGLLGLAAIALPARLAMLSGDDVRFDILEDNKINNASIHQFIDSRKAALHWRITTATLDELAMATYKLTTDDGSEQKNTKDEDALTWQREAVILGPLNPYGWVRMAQGYANDKTETARAAAALHLSFVTGPYEPRLALPRLLLVQNLDAFVDAATKSQLPDLMRQAWRTDPHGLARAAVEQHFIGLAEDALTEKPDDRPNFRDLVSKVVL